MKSNRATQEPRWVRYTLLSLGLGFLLFFLGLPLLAVFVEAFAQGWPAYAEALKEFSVFYQPTNDHRETALRLRHGLAKDAKSAAA